MADELEGYVLGTSAKHESTRYRKADKIIAVIEAHRPLAGAAVLEVGTGAGYIANVLSQRAASVESVDIVDDRKVLDGYRQTIVDDEVLPFADRSFDVVVTNHVLEHVVDQDRHLAEIRRVLADDGIVYLATPNKWWLTDPHYKLPFISWLPHRIASAYLRVTKHRKWDIHSVSLRGLHRLASRHDLVVEDQTWRILRDPAAYHLEAPALVATVARRLPGPLARLLSNVVPTHLKVLTPASAGR